MGNAFDRKMSDVAIAQLESKMKTIDTSLSPSYLMDMFYPVGSYYETSDELFDPNTAWGGTWEKEAEGLVHIGSGSNYSLGATGGAKEVTLTASQSGSPSHGHQFTQPTVNGGSITTGYNSNSGENLSGGEHRHDMGSNWSSGSGSETAYMTASDRTRTTHYTGYETHTHEIPGHTHGVPDHSHTVSGGAVQDSTGTNASAAHENMPPYVVINRWHRTA